MRLFGQHAKWEARLLAGLVGATVLGGARPTWAVQSIILTNSNPAAKSASYVYSAGLADILKMIEAKVDPEVIKAYIKNSPVAYNPSAAELIALKDKGVPPELLTALVQRGGELRAQGMQMAPGQPGAPGQQPQYPGYPGYPGTAAMNTGLPPDEYGAQYALPSYADYGYGYPPYYPPTYWWWNSWWPGVGFGFDSFDHFNHFKHFNHFNRFNRFNRFNQARFQNFDFNRFPNARFQNFDFNQSFNTQPFSVAPFRNVGFNRFNQPFFIPRTGLTELGVPSRAFAPGAIPAGGSSAVAFLGRNGGTAGRIQPPGGTFAPRGGGFAFRAGGGGHGMGGGGRGGGGGGGHR